MTTPKFDEYARNYESLHAKSIEASGESTEYFAAYKLDCLKRLGVETNEPILDYGCGIGNLTEQLVKGFGNVHGFDPSKESLVIANRRAPQAVLYEDPIDIPNDTFGTAVLSGVLHHVAPEERLELLREVIGKLRPGGRLVVFEHNPLNPLTRKAVADCPFDDDAILLYPWEAKRLLRFAGLLETSLDYIVFFPRPLALLRPLEPKLRRLFIGAQTMVVGKRAR